MTSGQYAEALHDAHTLKDYLRAAATQPKSDVRDAGLRAMQAIAQWVSLLPGGEIRCPICCVTVRIGDVDDAPVAAGDPILAPGPRAAITLVAPSAPRKSRGHQ